MHKPKDKDWLNGFKNKTPIYAVYRRRTYTRETYRLKVKGLKKMFHANRDEKKTGVAILISDKIDFQIKAVKRQRRRLQSDQRMNTRRRYNNYKYTWGRSQDGGEIGRGDHFLSYKFIKRTIER